MRLRFIPFALALVLTVAACGGSGLRGERLSTSLRAGGVLVEGSGGICAGKHGVFFSPYVQPRLVESPPPTVCDGQVRLHGFDLASLKLEPVGHGVQLGSAYVRGVYRNGALAVIAQGQPRHQQPKSTRDVLPGLRRVGATRGASKVPPVGTTSSPSGFHRARLSDSEVQKTIGDWRASVGHGALGKPLKLSRRAALAADAAHARVSHTRIWYGSTGTAVYLDLAASHPLRTLRQAQPLVRTLASSYPGGWAIRMRNARGVTVWIAGNDPSGGFVGSATQRIDAVSPVSHG